jgi:hypothetical protein
VTGWQAFDVPALWAMLSAEDDATSNAQTSGWFRVGDAFDAYRRHLEAWRADLTTRWPPERSPASQAFVARLDEMAASAAAMSEAASRNGSALSRISASLMRAKETVGGLHEQWQRQASVEGSSLPSSSHGAARTAPSTVWREQLNRQAQTAMAEAEKAVADDASYFVKAAHDRATVFGPDAGNDPAGAKGSGAPVTGKSRPGGVRPPAIPPLAPPTSMRADPIPGPGPALAGMPPSPIVGSQPTPQAPSAAGLTPTAPALPGGPLFVQTPAGRALAVGGVLGLTPAPTDRSGQLRTPLPPEPAAYSAMESGNGSRPPVPASSAPMDVSTGVFGGYAPAAGDRSTTARPGRRVNPVGGVIGAPPSGGEVHNTANGHTFTVSTSSRARRPEPVDPDDPWRVAEGGRPVIQPRPEPTHDPGPGVIGIDR